MTEIKRILVPHDFSDAAQNALELALDLAQRLGAQVTVMHAYEYPVLVYPEGPILTPDLVRDIERAAQAALDRVVSGAGRPGVTVDGALRQGSAWSEILAAAKDRQVDLIVLGTHGRRGLSRALLGSVAEKIVRTSQWPVLTVRGTEA